MENVSGNILFFILIVVALFFALAYAVTRSTHGGMDNASQEKAVLNEALTDQCSASVNAGIMRLTMNGNCSLQQISYELPDGKNVNSSAPLNKTCHLFHVNGGGIAPCGSYLTGDDPCMAQLAIGESCNSVIYSGVSGGNRIYTSLADSGTTKWASQHDTTLMNGVSNSGDGLANTNILINLTDDDAPYPAALLCRGLGDKWYLPARDELLLLYNNRNVGLLNGSFDTSGVYYWSSTEGSWHEMVSSVRFSSSASNTNKNKTASQPTRCVRRD